MRKALTGAPGRSGPPALHPAVYAAQFAKMGAFVLLVWGTIGAGRAEAIPIVHDQVKTIVFLAELPENAPVRKEAKDPGGKPTKLGYRYWYFHIFWASVWTWDGEFVAYQHEWVNPIRLGTDPKAAAEKAGLDPDAVYPPFFYRFPLGWWIAGVLFLLWSWKKLVEKGEPEQPQRQVPWNCSCWRIALPESTGCHEHQGTAAGPVEHERDPAQPRPPHRAGHPARGSRAEPGAAAGVSAPAAATRSDVGQLISAARADGRRGRQGWRRPGWRPGPNRRTRSRRICRR